MVGKKEIKMDFDLIKPLIPEGDKEFEDYLRMIFMEEVKWRQEQRKNIKKEWWEE